jgi:hypothetical protein
VGILGVAFFLSVAIWATAASDASALVALFFWGMTGLAGSFLAAVWLTYTEVGPHGLRVRTPTKLHTISWPDLGEVRSVRESVQDTIVFCTTDGRDVKAAGVAVAHIGLGRRAADRAVHDIERTWGRHR